MRDQRVAAVTLKDPAASVPFDLLFGAAEGRIAWANRGRDPRYLFGALQRQLGYPEVPRPPKRDAKPELPPAVEARLRKLEKRLQFLESEQKGGIDLAELAARPGASPRLDEPG